MQISRKLSRTNHQLYIGIMIGLSFSLFLNEIFRGSITNWKDPESRENAEFIYEPNLVSDVKNETSSDHKRVRVLCWVLTYPANHRNRAIHVKRTWGKRCDKLLFISSKEDAAIDAVAIPGAEDNRDWLWGKTKAALEYAWNNYREEFDWILKADDDTYVIVENLKKFLSNYSSTDPIFFGCQFHSPEISAWVSGGAGYVLSKEALRRFVVKGLADPLLCSASNSGAEDAEMAKCLIRTGSTLEDSRDALGRHRFLAFAPSYHLFPRSLEEKEKDFWYLRYLRYPQVQGMDCCANDAISYHYITPGDMYVFEYFLYHIRPDGVYEEEKYVQEYPLEYTDSTTTTTTTTTTPSTTTATPSTTTTTPSTTTTTPSTTTTTPSTTATTPSTTTTTPSTTATTPSTTTTTPSTTTTTPSTTTTTPSTTTTTPSTTTTTPSTTSATTPSTTTTDSSSLTAKHDNSSHGSN